MNSLAKALAVAAALVTVSPAPAAGPDDAEPRRERVSYADLDLASEDGRAKFDRRIKAASWRVCRMGALDLPTRMREQDCMAKIKARSAEQVAAIVAKRSGVELAGRGATTVVAR